MTDQQGQVNTTFIGGPTTYSNSASFTLPPDTSDQVTATVDDMGSSPTRRPQQLATSQQRTTAPLTIPSGPSCGSPSGTSVTCSWGAAQDKGSVTYHVSWNNGSATTLQTSYTMGGLPQDGAGHTFSVYATDDTGHTSGTASTGYTDPPNRNAPPTISNFVAINGGCGCGGGAAPQVGVAYTVTYPAGSSGGYCHFTRDGVELVSPPTCGQNGRASHQFYSQPTGSHTYCGFIQMPDGQKSNVLCQTITVT
jgi:hypothetical protein